jgi:hypothetical protein
VHDIFVTVSKPFISCGVRATRHGARLPAMQAVCPLTRHPPKHCERGRIFSMSFVRLKDCLVSQLGFIAANRLGNHYAVLWVSASWVTPCPLPLCGHPHACRRGQHAIEPLVFPWNDGRTPIARPPPLHPAPNYAQQFFLWTPYMCVWLYPVGTRTTKRHPTPPQRSARPRPWAWRGVCIIRTLIFRMSGPQPHRAPPRVFQDGVSPHTLLATHRTKTSFKSAHVSHSGTQHPLCVFERVARSTSHRRPGVHDLDS